jgi:hypothetical protein
LKLSLYRTIAVDLVSTFNAECILGKVRQVHSCFVDVPNLLRGWVEALVNVLEKVIPVLVNFSFVLGVNPLA